MLPKPTVTRVSNRIVLPTVVRTALPIPQARNLHAKKQIPVASRISFNLPPQSRQAYTRGQAPVKPQRIVPPILGHGIREQPPKPQVQFLIKDVPENHKRRMAELHGSERGRILIIVGNGPSILEVDLGELRHRKLIDIMSINKPDTRVWPTKYWSFFDASQLDRHRAIWDTYDGIIFNSPMVSAQKARSIQIRSIPGDGFSQDLVQGLHIGQSSVYASMQIALWLGYERTYIFGCLPDGETILTSRGSIPIDSLAFSDTVYTSHGFLPFTKMSRRWYDGDIFELTTAYNNIPLRITTEHPVLVQRDQQEVFVAADDLRLTDRCVFPVDMTECVDDYSNEIWWLLGLYAAEGYIRKVNNGYKDYLNPVICLGKHEIDLATKVTAICAGSLNCSATPDTRDRPAQELIINNDMLGRLAVEHVGTGSTTKFLSSHILQLPAVKALSFIMGYLEGDGSLFSREKTGYHECTFSTASEGLAEGVQKLLLRLKVVGSLIRSARPSGFLLAAGGFGTRHHINVIAGQLDRLALLLGIQVNTSGVALKDARWDGDKLITNIRGIIRNQYAGYVNNIEVPSVHTYGNHLVMTHNCDMCAVVIDGKKLAHFFGVNPDVSPESRVLRFDAEAKFYASAGESLPDDIRKKFYFCSAYNKYPFINKFNRLNHKTAIESVFEFAEQLAARNETLHRIDTK